MNRVLPPGGQFQAIVNGHPTGLAGCLSASRCPRASQCLRADDRLSYRADFPPPPADCGAFILLTGER